MAAPQALYRAKAGGRNRVEQASLYGSRSHLPLMSAMKRPWFWGLIGGAKEDRTLTSTMPL